MTDYAALKEEINEPEYAGMTDMQIAAALEAPITVPVDADPQAAYRILMASATYDWGRVVSRSHTALTGTAASDSVVLSAINLTEAFQAGRTVLRTSQPDDLAKLMTDLTALQAAGDVSQASADAIVALTATTTTRAQQLGFDPAIHDMFQEISAARNWTP